MKHLGFTGSDKRLAPAQEYSLAQLLTQLRAKDFTELHHGDCLGGDDICDRLARNRSFNIHIHPPLSSSKRAFCGLKVTGMSIQVHVYKARPYLKRDDDIARAVEALVACPQENHIEVLRSGVWATVRYARREKKTIYIIWPDGRLEYDRKS